MANDNNSFAHTRWNCKYHVVFTPKYRRKIFYGEKREAIGKILRKLCEWKGIQIHEAEVCIDHVHMLVSIPPKVSVSSFMECDGELAIVRDGVNASSVVRQAYSRYGVINKAGECVIPCSDEKGSSFAGNHYLIVGGNRWSDRMKIIYGVSNLMPHQAGIADRDGNLLYPQEYDIAYHNGRFYLLDQYGKLTILR